MVSLIFSIVYMLSSAFFSDFISIILFIMIFLGSSCNYSSDFLKLMLITNFLGLPRWHSGREPTCQSRRHKKCGFNPWVKEIPWRKKWQPTWIFLPVKSHGWESMADYSSWGCKESDKTEQLTHDRKLWKRFLFLLK